MVAAVQSRQEFASQRPLEEKRSHQEPYRVGLMLQKHIRGLFFGHDTLKKVNFRKTFVIFLLKIHELAPILLRKILMEIMAIISQSVGSWWKNRQVQKSLNRWRSNLYNPSCLAFLDVPFFHQELSPITKFDNFPKECSCILLVVNWSYEESRSCRANLNSCLKGVIFLFQLPNQTILIWR